MSRFVMKKIVRQKSKQAAFHPGPVLPPSSEGSPFKRNRLFQASPLPPSAYGALLTKRNCL